MTHFTTLYEADTSEGVFKLTQWTEDGTLYLDIEGVESVELTDSVREALRTILKMVQPEVEMTPDEAEALAEQLKAADYARKNADG